MNQQLRVLITGAAGSLARDLIARFGDDPWAITGFDANECAHPRLDRMIVGDLLDEAALAAAVANQDVVVHLAGIPLEDEWERLLHTNIDGTYRLLEAAQHHGVRRVVIASSIHAVGFHRIRPDVALSEQIAILPDTLYGVTKAAAEALGAYFHRCRGVESISLRIASRQETPNTRRTLRTWLSPDDAARLVRVSITCTIQEPTILWGVSANTNSPFDQSAARELGYAPQDDGNVYRDTIEQIPFTNDPSAPWLQYIGGEFCSGNPPRMRANVAPGNTVR